MPGYQLTKLFNKQLMPRKNLMNLRGVDNPILTIGSREWFAGTGWFQKVHKKGMCFNTSRSSCTRIQEKNPYRDKNVWSKKKNKTVKPHHLARCLHMVLCKSLSSTHKVTFQGVYLGFNAAECVYATASVVVAAPNSVVTTLLNGPGT